MKASKLSGLLSFAASVGVVATAVLTGIATVKAMDEIDEWMDEKHDELTTFEKIQAGAKHYVAAVGAGIATIICINESHRISKEEIALVTGAAVAATKRYDEYRKANIETNGREAHEKAMAKVAAVDAKDANIAASSLLMTCQTGESWENGKEQLFYDSITKQYFKSTLAKVMAAEYHINRNFTNGYPDVNVQMWCDFLGIPNKNKDERGWTYNDEFSWLDFNNSKPRDIGDGVKASIIECAWTPIEGYLEYDCLHDEWPCYCPPDYD
ncbi:MAG: hypothetical protein J6U54_03530 [Clostridiales bacterium]|nr:hypothetical protein [Clostridiales bacterium]